MVEEGKGGTDTKLEKGNALSTRPKVLKKRSKDDKRFRGSG